MTSPPAFCAPPPPPRAAPAPAEGPLLCAPRASLSFRPTLRRTLARSRCMFSAAAYTPSLAGLPYYGPARAPLFALPVGPGGGGGGAGFGARRGDGGGGGDEGGSGADRGAAASALLGVLLARYSQLLVSAPVRTKAVTSGALMLLSDYLAQALTQPVVEVERLLRFLVYGVLVAGPATHAWYAVLDRVVAATGVRGIVAKVALDQLVMSHVFLAAFFAFMTLAEGRSAEAVPAVLAAEHVPAFLASLKVWPLVNMVNFSVVPPQYRVVFGSAVNVGWITFLSISSAASKPLPPMEIARAGS